MIINFITILQDRSDRRREGRTYILAKGKNKTQNGSRTDFFLKKRKKKVKEDRGKKKQLTKNSLKNKQNNNNDNNKQTKTKRNK